MSMTGWCLTVKMTKIMFLCTGNTCRSQMAEGFARAIGKDAVEVHSAGIKAEGFVNPLAIKVMKEIGIDISGHKSKMIETNLLNSMDIIVTLCGHADETCPLTPPGIRRIHIPVDDPSKVSGSDEEILAAFRKARDEIRERVDSLLSY